jgi:integrase/recombinase XerD
MLKYTSKFILRKDHKPKKGLLPVLLQAFLCGKRVRIRLDVYLKEAEWSEEKQICRIQNDREKEARVNSLLAKHKGRVEELFYEARMTGQPLTTAAFLAEFDNRTTAEVFSDFIETEIEKERADKEPSTVKQYVSLNKHLRGYSPTATFADINFDFVQGFDRYLRKNGIGDNARAKYHTLVRKFIFLAQKKRRRIPNPYTEFKVRSVPVERTWLSVHEVDALVNLYRSRSLGPQLHATLRQFLFQCVTSVRVSDIHQIEHSDIVGGMLVFSPVKTKNLRKVVKIPLSELARQIIAESDGRNGKVFNSVPDATTNLRLKEIAAFAKIDKRITTHVGRHTFGFLYLLMGGKVEELQEIMGHSKLETTQIYTHTDHDKKVAGVLKFDQVFKLS